MIKQMFLNLPVKDLGRSVDFFTKLGFTFNSQFADENATCMIVNENIFVMLLVEKFFQTFTTKTIVDASKSCELITALSVESREVVDGLMKKAFDAGATKANDPQDHGWMYSCSFQDPDGHIWEFFTMDQSAIPQS